MVVTATRPTNVLEILLVSLAIFLAAYLGRAPSVVPVVVGVATVVGASVYRRPRLGWMIVLWAAVPTVELGTDTESGISLAMIVLSGVCAVATLRHIIDRCSWTGWHRDDWPWLALSAVCMLSLVHSRAVWNPVVVVKDNFVLVQGAQCAIFVVTACGFWFATRITSSPDDLRRVLFVFAVSAAIQIVAGFVAMPSGSVGTLGTVSRIWAAVLAGAIGLFNKDLSLRLRLAVFGIAVLLVAVPASIQSDWQSGWLPGCIGLVTVVGLALRARYSRLLVWCVILTMLAVGVVVMGDVVASESWSLETRLIAWRGLVDLLGSHWPLGLGLASYWHYWRDVIGVIAYDDVLTGVLHYTYDPQVNMHNNYLDVLAQLGALGLGVVVWLFASLYRSSYRLMQTESHFLRAYGAASVGGLSGMLVAGMMGDWLFPFVYNVGLGGFRDSIIGWLFLAGTSGMVRRV